MAKLIGISGGNALVAFDGPSGLTLYSIEIKHGRPRRIGTDGVEPGVLHNLALTRTAWIYKRDTRMLPPKENRGVAIRALPLVGASRPFMVRGWGSDAVSDGSVVYWIERAHRGTAPQPRHERSASSAPPAVVLVATLYPDGHTGKVRVLSQLVGDVTLGACDARGVYVRLRRAGRPSVTLRLEEARRTPRRAHDELWHWPHVLQMGRRVWLCPPALGGASAKDMGRYGLWTSTDDISATRMLRFDAGERPIALLAGDNALYAVVLGPHGPARLERIELGRTTRRHLVFELPGVPMRDQVRLLDGQLFFVTEEVQDRTGMPLRAVRLLWRRPVHPG
jgi:hypothetical protein